MKEKILEIIKESMDFVSGEEISKSLGVSRAAIWKHMKALKEEGYIIEAVSKKGYKLLKSPDLLTPKEVLPLINTRFIGREIIYFDVTDSTNNVARQYAMEGFSEGLVVIAEEQTKGKGRLGRPWETKSRQSIAFSVVLRPFIKPQDAPGITIVLGTAVCRALRNITSLKAGIKWPNDVIINGKKVCGILTEMSSEADAVNYIIAGVGINVNTSDFPEELKNIATSLKIEGKKEYERRVLLAEVLYQLESLYKDFKEQGLKNILEEFKSYSVTLNKRVKAASIKGTIEGLACDITGEGLLVIRLDNGEERKIVSGDVSVRGLGTYV
ncbi:bifunctional ligase/repressor BirA [Oxobacter pfennigii]|uniref:Bifunctional ligase/repressor BirA n=1 Tax=Oxobacter pfennigii TaxID=36849 RepID=A0A0P8WWS3_9CLOT|nr:biotin--[acetyl-CoA-carboxylase] ligase [Oxobacter pfennigii]KPU42729.1 bifunctional ligase/repressor BirA [Oxobacter pfennigii]